jgi:hypothetical protein
MQRDLAAPADRPRDADPAVLEQWSAAWYEELVDEQLISCIPDVEYAADVLARRMVERPQTQAGYEQWLRLTVHDVLHAALIGSAAEADES